MAVSSKRKASKKKSKPVKPTAKRSYSKLLERVERLEGMLDLVLQASLRGRLLPAGRREIKRYLEERKQELEELQVEKKKKAGPKCPVCKLRLPNPDAEKCPHCSVILSVVLDRKK